MRLIAIGAGMQCATSWLRRPALTVLAGEACAGRESSLTDAPAADADTAPGQEKLHPG
ncbi:hypothetical protein ACFQY5_18730 [Paeniroseomonas aquatica]|uniref:hypothetical protein n=1 Tax=Paeniroseomonas aquatica TaxID=373043 RepID=UPI0036117624